MPVSTNVTSDTKINLRRKNVLLGAPTDIFSPPRASSSTPIGKATNHTNHQINA